MAEAQEPTDAECCEAFRKFVDSEHGGKKLADADRCLGKSTAVSKLIKEGLKEPGLVSICDSSIMPVHQDKKTKKIKDDVFIKECLPKLAKEKCKKKSKGKEPPSEDVEKELRNMKISLCQNAGASKQGPKGGAKADSVTSRLTDAKGYTGAHKERFDTKTGKGKGLEGREDKVDGSGYVGNYKGQDTYDKKH